MTLGVAPVVFGLGARGIDGGPAQLFAAPLWETGRFLHRSA